MHHPTRRTLLSLGALSAAALVTGCATHPPSPLVHDTAQPQPDPEPASTTPPSPAAPFRPHAWQRHPKNPVLPPGPRGSFDSTACMNPFALRVGDQYFLYYAGGDPRGAKQICLATAPVDDITRWTRLGPLFPRGKPRAFDDSWCVLPCVHFIHGKWHLYYTGRSTVGSGLQAFWGIGLATSDDMIHWTRQSTEPLIRGDGFPDWPNNRGIAGGARIIELPQPDGKILYRMYYTLATGTTSPSLLVDQAKQAVVAHSYDGLSWFDKRVVLRPRLDAKYENAATIALNVWKTNTRWRAIYAGIGSQYHGYAICEATSHDGLNWERGRPGQNLALPPAGKGWESRNTEYPNVIEENGKLRLFYCGNGYGATGIGTALAEKID